MENKVCFIGHRDIAVRGIEDRIRQAVIKEIENGATCFMVGSHGMFDKIVLTDAAGVKPKMTFYKWYRKMLFKCGKLAINIFWHGDKKNKKLNELRDKYSSSDYKALKSDVMKETFKKVIALDLTENLKDIDRPTLIMWGENDLDTPLYMAKKMASEIKNSGLVVLEKAGHFSYLDASDKYNIIVDKFLGGE